MIEKSAIWNENGSVCQSDIKICSWLKIETNLDDVDEEPDDEEGDGAHDVEEGELLPSPHLASKTKITLEHNIESA